MLPYMLTSEKEKGIYAPAEWRMRLPTRLTWDIQDTKER